MEDYIVHDGSPEANEAHMERVSVLGESMALPPRIKTKHRLAFGDCFIPAGTIGNLNAKCDRYCFEATVFYDGKSYQSTRVVNANPNIVTEESFEFLWPRKVKVPVITPLENEPRMLRDGEIGYAEGCSLLVFTGPTDMFQSIPCKITWEEREVGEIAASSPTPSKSKYLNIPWNQFEHLIDQNKDKLGPLDLLPGAKMTLYGMTGTIIEE